MRICRKCLEVKDVSCFGLEKRNRDGISRQCKDCINKATRHRSEIRRNRNITAQVDYTVTKSCTYCKLTKSLSEFQKKLSNNDKRDSICKSCANNILRDKRLKVKDITIEGNKICKVCSKEKSLSEFTIEAGGISNRRNSCKECRNIESVNRVSKNKSELNIYYWNRRAKAVNSNCLKRHNINDKVVGSELKEIYESQHGKCFYCKVFTDIDFELDHKISLSNGGLNNKENIVIACSDCNRLKFNRNSDNFLDFVKKYVLRFRE